MERTITLRERLQVTWLTWKFSGARGMEPLDDYMDDHYPEAHEGLKAYVEQREARLRLRSNTDNQPNTDGIDLDELLDLIRSVAIQMGNLQEAIKEDPDIANLPAVDEVITSVCDLLDDMDRIARDWTAIGRGPTSEPADATDG